MTGSLGASDSPSGNSVPAGKGTFAALVGLGAMAMVFGQTACGGNVGSGGSGAGGSQSNGSGGASANGSGGAQSNGSGGMTGTGKGGSSSGGATAGASGAGASGTGGASPGSGGAGTGGTAIGGSGGGVSTAGKVPIFVAQGGVGRTTISCDDGKTWIANHSWDIDADPMMCGMKQTGVCDTGTCKFLIGGKCVTNTCCHDTPDVPKGVIYGGGQFVATWGWGQPGSVRRSTDGITWTETHPADIFGGIAYGGGRFVAASRTPIWSTDGTKWNNSAGADFRNSDGSQMWSVRRFGQGDYPGGTAFVAAASGNTNADMLVSSDGGQTWWRPKTIPAGCMDSVSVYGDIVSGNGVIVMVGQSASACRSVDGGKTWTIAPTGVTEVLSAGVWTGSEFRFWGNVNNKWYMLGSPDGATWTKTLMATQTWIEPVARSSATGTYVAMPRVFDGYQAQSFMRSTDGLTWTTLPKTAFVPSHGIFFITFGYAEPSAACPAP